MNYKLELRTQESKSNIVFNNILFDAFKVNIIEKYAGKMTAKPILSEVVFKVRTLDDTLVMRKDGHIRIKVKGDDFQIYQNLSKILNSYDYKHKLINRANAEQDYVHYMLSLVIANYQLN
ncbi:hypothetical protein SAMN05443633_104297 [Chryseobacterium arachidis]|uniref:Prevent-host-death protein n=1 Tax=Chryseobacterium arachidis TaxID=1416778 RepID=A0A1M5BUI4_9FLAO|nr:prevent-host-death protein [Chryseobacterium arachidis]SHF46080.1 hypothetical protein SAMN05443633_104297 [Chryseobacterium arachidis]